MWSWSTGTRKTPTKAASLPIPAAIPCPVVRMLTGKTSEGSTNVVMLRQTSGYLKVNSLRMLGKLTLLTCVYCDRAQNS